MSTIVQFADVNARRADYSPDLLRVTGLFATVQGEGPFTGYPAVFLRLAGCNLGAKDSCPWCDSYFALAASTVMTIESVLRAARSKWRGRQGEPLLVLTGGEPLLQPAAPGLILALLVDGWQVQIETNGYFWPAELAPPVPSGLTVVVSPKVNIRQVYPPLPAPLWLHASALKILVDSDPASPYHLPPRYAYEFPGPVYLSPINHYRRDLRPGEVATMWGDDTPYDLPRCAANHRYAAQLVMEMGFRLSLQQHLWAGLE